MPRPLHIVMTVNAAWNIVNFRMPLVNALLADGHKITVLAPADDSVARLREAGCGFVDLNMDKKGLNPLRDGGLLIRFRRHFKRLGPDLVLSFTIKNNVFGALAAKSLGLRFVPNVTGLGTAFLSGGLLLQLARTLYRLAFRKLPTVFFQNRDDRDLFLETGLVTDKQAELLPGSGIDLSAFSPAPYPRTGDQTRFLLVARLIRDKGVMEFVEAARILRRDHPSLRFQLLGAIGFANRTSIDRALVEQWQDEGLVDYLGTVDDVRPLMADAHCIVLPSYREGAPRTLIEGAAMARPAIATDVPGCNSVVDDGETGLLCNVRDAADLADKVRTFAALDDSEKRAMGLAARAKIEREFSVDIVIAAYRSLIAELIDSSPGPEGR